MNNGLAYKRVVPGSLSDEEWMAFYDLVFHQMPHAAPRKNIPSLKVFQSQRLRMVQSNDVREFLLLDQGTPFGRVIYGTHNLGAADEAPFALFNTLHDSYSSDTARFLGQLFLEQMQDFAHERVFLTIWQDKNEALLQQLGGRFLNNLILLELNRKQIDVDAYRQWADHALLDKLGLYAVRASSLPDELMDDYAQLNQVLFEDMIRSGGEVPQENSTAFFRNLYRKAADSGQRWHHILLIDQAQELAGFTLLVRLPDTPETLHQRTTVVRRDLRRHSLARWLKASMVLDVLDKFDDWNSILTECYQENFPILKLNKEMGFGELAGKKEYILEKGELEKGIEWLMVNG